MKVNKLIAVLLEDGESEGDIDVAALEGGGAPAPAAEAPKKKQSPRRMAQRRHSRRLHLRRRQQRSLPAGAFTHPPSPNAWRRNEGLDISAIKGSGPKGRVVKRDVEKALKDGTGKSGAPAREFVAAPASVDERLYPPESYDAVKVDGMRKVIAKRLTQSFNNEVPHFPLNVDVELDGLLAARKRINALSPEGDGAYKVSVNDFVIKASALALKAVPEANATYTDEAILLHKHADIGVAVAIDGGLITPIVWKAEEKGLKQISAEIKDMASRAKSRKLKPEEYQGGTFSVSNLGMFGITSFASIVNQPHGAIMSVGAGEQRVVVRDGEMVIPQYDDRNTDLRPPGG